MSAQPEAKPPSGLTYPWERTVPAPGETIKVADGILWVRMPMPMRLDHINVWLIEDGEGWTLVDTGLSTAPTHDYWRSIFKNTLRGKPITRVYVTHLHPDHIGNAGWITELFDCMLWMSRTDYLLCRAMATDTGRDAPMEGVNFFKAAGLTDAQLRTYREKFGSFGANIFRLPQSYRRVVDREVIRIGAHDWTVIVGRGHAPEHACLWCPALNVFISGDQLLPRISSNVSVFPTEPFANPLDDWLSSCRMLKDLLPAETLVLPAHNEPFIGGPTRLANLIREHETGLAALLELCRTPKRAVDVFDVLFKSKITDGVVMMATTESLAHLNYLIARGDMTRTTDADGVSWYQARAA